MDKRPKSAELAHHIWACCETKHASAPLRLASLAQIFEHPCMLQNKGHIRTVLRKLRCLGQMGNVSPDRGISTKISAARKAVGRVFMPVELLPNPAHQ